MKGATHLQYHSKFYTGPAIKLNAGMQVEEAYEAAHAYDSVVVGGDCATVGVVGGYLQGMLILMQCCTVAAWDLILPLPFSLCLSITTRSHSPADFLTIACLQVEATPP